MQSWNWVGNDGTIAFFIESCASITYFSIITAYGLTDIVIVRKGK
jgi:hypothetical protein